MNDARRHAMLLIVLFASATATAGPTGAELAATCTRALAADYAGIDAGICEWYVVPCPVCDGQPRNVIACPPPDADSRTLALVVVAALKVHPGAASEQASAIVPEILSAAYPCPGPPPGE